MNRAVRYGPLDDQVGDLWLPEGARPPVVCLLHGGFWRMPYGREQMNEIAQDMASIGCAVWNIEYRRLGGAAAGWRETCQDAADAIGFLARLQADLDLDRVAVIGHSAGGHLALWAAAQRKAMSAVIAEAPLTDLKLAYDLGVDPDTVAKFLDASPRDMLPIGVPQFILHGAADTDVPVEMSRAYVKAAKDAGDPVELIEVPGVGHMEFLDPASRAHQAARQVIRRVLRVAAAQV
jgi:acetyl esterase/lipase